MHNILVQKFGGAAVSNQEGIQNSANIISKSFDNKKQVIVVVSAMLGTTNSLIQMFQSFSKSYTQKIGQEYDMLLSTGELIASALLSLELKNLGYNSYVMPSWKIPIVTNNNHGNALIQNLNTDYILSLLKKNIIPIIPGFQGVTRNNEITTLGKGGSDITAVALAASLGAKFCNFYKDVEGVLTADPRLIKNVKNLSKIDHKLMIALSEDGAKILNTRAILLAMKHNINLNIFNYHRPEKRKSLIYKSLEKMENFSVTAITYDKNILKAHIISNIIDNKFIFNIYSNNIIIDNIYQISANNWVLFINLKQMELFHNTLEILKKESKISHFHLDTTIAKISIIGYYLKQDTSFYFKILTLLSENNIEIFRLDINDLKFSIFLKDKFTEQTTKLLYEALFNS